MYIKIGIIGVGFMGRKHISSFSKLDGVEVVGGVTRSTEKSRLLEDDYGVNPYQTIGEMLENEQLDIVDICLPTPLHRDALLSVAGDVGGVICEKPIARTLSDALEMKKIADDEGFELYVGHVVRFFPEYVKIRERILDGDIGEAGVVRTFRGGGTPTSRAGWYSDVDRSGGVVLDLLIHDFDWLRWAVGEVDRVYAKGLTYTDASGDMALVTLRLKSGALAHVEGSWAHPSDYPFTTSVEVAGSDGLISYNSNDAKSLSYYPKCDGGDDGGKIPNSPLSEDPWTVQLEHFIECYRAGSEPRVSVEGSISALRISLAALRSLKIGEPVEVGDYLE